MKQAIKLRPVNRRGKIRRAKGLAVKIQCRLDQVSIDLLRKEFGSVGNAMYFLAQNIQALRSEFTREVAHIEPPPALTTKESLFILELLKDFLEQDIDIRQDQGGKNHWAHKRADKLFNKILNLVSKK